jgi:hypothetical protein
LWTHSLSSWLFSKVSVKTRHVKNLHYLTLMISRKENVIHMFIIHPNIIMLLLQCIKYYTLNHCCRFSLKSVAFIVQIVAQKHELTFSKSSKGYYMWLLKCFFVLREYFLFYTVMFIKRKYSKFCFVEQNDFPMWFYFTLWVIKSS